MGVDTKPVLGDDVLQQWREQGVVYLPQALSAEWVERLAAEHGRHMKAGGQMWRWREFPAYLDAARESPIADIVRQLWGTDDVWWLYDQVFQKGQGYSARTPWHQDLSYLAVDGDDLAVVWITFDEVNAGESLEFVPGSHRGVLYNGFSYDPKKIAEDETAPLFRTDELPRLPPIQKERDDWEIVSWAITPGDLVIFHPGLLHGGAPVLESTRRRTLSMRFFGSDAVYAKRPAKVGPPIPELHDALTPGDPFRWTEDWFPKLR